MYSNLSITLVGTVLPYGGTSVDTSRGWLLCDGNTIGNTGSGATYTGPKYKSLFDILKAGMGDSAIWTSGGTITLPDMRGNFFRAIDDSPTEGCTCRGDETRCPGCQFQCSSIGLHCHGVYVKTNTSTGVNADQNQPYCYPSGTCRALSCCCGGNETRPRNVYVNFIIKY